MRRWAKEDPREDTNLSREAFQLPGRRRRGGGGGGGGGSNGTHIVNVQLMDKTGVGAGVCLPAGVGAGVRSA
ncbi:hypothetical protein E2C01_054775 [Portunus trituberculatus]|uniref:Uncharacterized protein n=1 Tax=Portunus trituberculatus TaxID=210409 RepID=A0A5B7GSU8_PORTR|nr:hypothetical protein [Portunus trituberculatus]